MFSLQIIYLRYLNFQQFNSIKLDIKTDGIFYFFYLINILMTIMKLKIIHLFFTPVIISVEIIS